MNNFIFIAVLLGNACICAQVYAHVDISTVACQTNDTDPEDDLELDGDELFYVDFGKKETVSATGDFLPKYRVAEGWVPQAEAEHQICLNNLDVAVQAENNPPEQIDPPQITIYPRDEVELGRTNQLICFVNNFYPPPVRVKWTKNNNEVKNGVALSRYYPNTDFTFRQYSTLSFTPGEGDVYSCTVQHKGLQEPETKIWEPEIQKESDMAETAFCGIGLTLGLLGVGAGTFFLVKGNNCN